MSHCPFAANASTVAAAPRAAFANGFEAIASISGAASDSTALQNPTNGVFACRVIWSHHADRTASVKT